MDEGKHDFPISPADNYYDVYRLKDGKRIDRYPQFKHVLVISPKGMGGRSMHQYRPGWTFSGWVEAKEVVKKKFTASQERKEAVGLVRNLARKIAKSGLILDRGTKPGTTLVSSVLTASEAARDIDEFRLFINLGIRLAENRLILRDTLKDGIPAATKAAKDRDELILIVNLGIKLAERRISPTYTLKDGIPAVAKVAKDRDEFASFVELGMKLAGRGIDPWDTLIDGIPTAAEAIAGRDGRKVFIGLGMKIAETGLDPVYALQYAVPAAAEVAKNIDELRNLADYLLDRHIEFAEGITHPEYPLGYTIPMKYAMHIASKVTKGVDEVKDMCDYLFALGRRFDEKKKGPRYTFEYMLAAAEKAESIDELKDLRDSLFDLNVKLDENKIDPKGTLEEGLPTAREAAKDVGERRVFINLGLRLAESGIDPWYTLQYAIPAVAGVAKDIDELMEACDSLLVLNTKFGSKKRLGDAVQFRMSKAAKKRLEGTLKFGIPAAAKVAKDMDEFKLFVNLGIKIAEKRMHPRGTLEDGIPAASGAISGIDERKLFIDLGIRIADKGMDPKDTLQYAVPAVYEVAKDIDELRNIFDALVVLNENLIILRRAHNPKEFEWRDPDSWLPPRRIGKWEDSSLEEGIPTAAVEANNAEELIVFIYLGIKLAEKGLSPYNLLGRDTGLNLREVSKMREQYGDVKVVASDYVPTSFEPLAVLDSFENTVVLFRHEHIIKRLNLFKKAVARLTINEGNIPVVLFTEGTEQDVISELESKGVPLEGVQFRTLSELGLQDFKLNRAMAAIEGLGGLKCIPLTEALADTFRDLRKARDKV